MQSSAHIAGFVTLLASGLMAGLFYAYSVSVMWGLDRADPRHAISSMNGINVAILNPLFMVLFLGLPLLTIATAVLFWQSGRSLPFWLFAASAAAYLVGTFGVTMAVHVPMNDALAKVTAPPDIAAAQEIWTSYSSAWLPWNHVRAIAATLSFALAGLGLMFA